MLGDLLRGYQLINNRSITVQFVINCVLYSIKRIAEEKISYPADLSCKANCKAATTGQGQSSSKTYTNYITL